MKYDFRHIDPRTGLPKIIKNNEPEIQMMTRLPGKTGWIYLLQNRVGLNTVGNQRYKKKVWYDHIDCTVSTDETKKDAQHIRTAKMPNVGRPAGWIYASQIHESFNQKITKSLNGFKDIKDVKKGKTEDRLVQAISDSLVESLFHNDNESHIDYVDLDLPSGTLWCKNNLGADKPEDSGDLFAWGEIKTKDTYNKNTYQYSQDDTYNNLPLKNDAAYVNTKGDYRIPTSDEAKELINHTNIEYKNNGVKFISKKDPSKWIFIPKVHTKDQQYSYDDGKTYVCVWTSSPAKQLKNCAWSLLSSWDKNARLNMIDYYIGIPIRPVRIL